VHRPLGQQGQNGRADVTAAPAAAATAAPTAAPAARAEAGTEAGAEAGAEARPEPRRPVVAPGMIAEVFEELLASLPPGGVQGAPSPVSGWDA